MEQIKKSQSSNQFFSPKAQMQWPEKERSKHAAITIISKNYLSFAQTLADSYKKYHPENDFIIVLVDIADENIPGKLNNGAEIIEISKFRIPDLERFIYRYTILELNTAAKPFVLSDLFTRCEYETLVYIDPDIWIFRPLEEVYEAFTDASIVLTPHMRMPYYDNDFPNDINILQSGTYNLGFIGLKKGETSQRLLDWWMTKLYKDCIVDIANGLFVDQKWIDLVPGFFPDHKIIYDPSYNVAYWNLHERELSGKPDDWLINGQALSFFHFSGYTPFLPQDLSKHQRRYQLDKLPKLKQLTDSYAAMLFQNGYEESISWPYAYNTLANGVKLPMGIVRDVMQWASRNKVMTPNPILNPDEFCIFLMSRINIKEVPNTILLFYFLLKRRTDVARECPNALHNSADPDFRNWLANSGAKEESLGDILAFEENNNISDYVADIFNHLRKNSRSDVFQYFDKLWVDEQVFEEFCDWILKHGVKELGLEQEHFDRINQAKSGPYRILNLYFLRGDLQQAFPALWEKEQCKSFKNWLYQHQYDYYLSQDEISLFYEFALARHDLLAKMSFLYAHNGERKTRTPSIYTLDDRRESYPNSKEMVEWLFSDESIQPVDHFIAKFGKNHSILEKFNRYSVASLSSKDNFSFVKSIQTAFNQEKDKRVVNLAGFLSAPSGMGESSRSMSTTLQSANVETTTTVLPHPFAQSDKFPTEAVMFGWPSGLADLSISVANADTSGVLERILPSLFWAKKNIGYWVWETEQLPDKFRDADVLFDEIWTPSHYSANSIQATLGGKVRVVPHTLNFAGIDHARPNRRKYGLPEKGILFGFIFDPLSILERKNISGLINAFKKAFSKDDNCYLILKVNGRAQGDYDYEQIRAQVDSDRILFVESNLSRENTFNFLKSLDVYASLHRSEGFGLTCAEAMALGIPTIATNYSGNLEFMDEKNSLLVDSKVIQTDRSYGPYPQGTRWGEPDLEHAAELFRELLDPDKRKYWGEQGAISIRKKLSTQLVGKIAAKYIHKILKT